jgi:hypothetical protein
MLVAYPVCYLVMPMSDDWSAAPSRFSPRPTQQLLSSGLTLGTVIIGLSLAVAACGGGAPSASVAHIGSTTTVSAAGSPESAGPSGNVNSQLERFVSCMRAHGVPNFPNLVPSPNGGAVPAEPVAIDPKSPAVQAARADCQSILPAEGPSPGPAITTKDETDYIKAAGCMRAHGVPDFPDPTFSGDTVRFVPPPGMNARIGNSPQFLRARQICEVLIPAGLPYSR